MDTANAPKALLVSKIVQKYVRHNHLPPSELPNLIAAVHQTLQQVGMDSEPEQPRTPAVPIRRSVTHNAVVCLECGWRGHMLRRHIRTSHGLDRDQYRARWELPRDHPLTAPAYAERRSVLAKEFGLGHGRGREAAQVRASQDAATEAAEAGSDAAVQEASSSRRRRGRPRKVAQQA